MFDRIGHCGVIVAAAFAILPSTAMSQSSSLRDQLVGVWVPTAHETTFPDGAKHHQFGDHPQGMMILDANGDYTQILVRPDLPKYRSNDRANAMPEEHAATVKGSVANFGTWSVDDTTKMLTYHIRGSTFPNQVGTDLKATVNVTGDEWTSTISKTTSGRQSVMTWKRAK